MLMAVIGGKLQGVEAVYLARKAGWQTLVIDKNPLAPATGLCDRFLEFEFSRSHPVPPGCSVVDLIFPALEDTEVLAAVEIWARAQKIPLVFDRQAYSISSSKLKSNALFRRLNFPVPMPWPGCAFPVVVKPDQASGSRGVEVFQTEDALSERFPDRQGLENQVIQEYIEGPSYSIEVVGLPGNYQALQVTDLEMDKTYDCKRVTAPSQLPAPLIRRFEKMAIALADAIGLSGIMDLEGVLNRDELKLLEIDARFPSQTPMAVYGSTGINMVDLLARLFLNKPFPAVKQKWQQFCAVEHIRVSGSVLDISGEHIMAEEGPLTLHAGFFGADEAITSFSQENHQWVATLIFTGISQQAVAAKRETAYQQILDYSGSMHGGQTQ